METELVGGEYFEQCPAQWTEINIWATNGYECLFWSFRMNDGKHVHRFVSFQMSRVGKRWSNPCSNLMFIPKNENHDPEQWQAARPPAQRISDKILPHKTLNKASFHFKDYSSHHAGRDSRVVWVLLLRIYFI
jgi:hypothetical protein